MLDKMDTCMCPNPPLFALWTMVYPLEEVLNRFTRM